ncbi:MAG TPA: hypothetical protein VNO50_15280 [Pyrinomonadaceae bacterium]|nr:hypothetical protein [Pyrinomonadaceae bacterium]
MKNADAWVKLLYTYGPFALLILLIFVTERISRTAMKEATQQKTLIVFVGVYVVNWLAIFFLVGFSVYAWSEINLERKPEIYGTIENLSHSELLSTSFEDVYLRRVRQAKHSNYEWLLRRDKLDDGETIVFTIDRSEEDGEDSFDYDLPIKSDFYGKKVRLIRDQDDIFFAGAEKPLFKRRKLLGAPEKPVGTQQSRGFFTITAHAQTDQKSFSLDDFIAGLESPDVLVRRSVRADLANQDQATVLPWIDEVLKDPKSSYRLRLGVLIALNNMPNLPAESLRPTTIYAIQRSLNDPDRTLRNEALSLAKRYRLIPSTVYEHFDFSGKSQVFGPGRYRFDKEQLGNLPNDSASSLRVGRGFMVRLCEHEGGGQGDGICETKGAGSHQLQSGIKSLADKVSFIQVTAITK